MRIKIEFECVLPQGIEATDEQITEYLRFVIGDIGEISLVNPFAKEDVPETVFGTMEWKKI